MYSNLLANDFLYGKNAADRWAEELFRQVSHRGLRQLWRRFRQRTSDCLQDLGTLLNDGQIAGQRHAGLQIVPLNQIHGSASKGRTQEFDCDFRPKKRHLADRWLSVARAWYRGQQLPPIQLVQVSDRYFVRDGHHRISVARAVGQETIPAEVIVMEIEKRTTS